MTSERTLPTPDEFEHELARFINRTLLGGGASVDRDTRLFEDGYMNSLRILDLIAFVEKTLGSRVPDRAVRLANFRTIAAIGRTFHPDVASATTAAPQTDRVFERRRDRSRFASPLDALVRRGDVVVTGTGQVALSGLALAVFGAVDRTVSKWATALGAREHRYPSLIDIGVLQRAGQVATAPSHSDRRPNSHSERSEESLLALSGGQGFLAPLGMTTEPSLGMTASHTLAPAVCYHAYPELEGQTLPSEPTLLTAVGRCYRYEDGNHIPLERLWEFTMREIIILGARDQVEATRQALIGQVSHLVAALDLDATIDVASDPFFAAGDEGRRLMQRAGALKHELHLAVDAGGHTVAAASFNHHHDFFGTRFGIQLADGTPAHSGCVAFGLERWVLALLAQHGVDETGWPTAARDWLRDAHASPTSSGARA